MRNIFSDLSYADTMKQEDKNRATFSFGMFLLPFMFNNYVDTKIKISSIGQNVADFKTKYIIEVSRSSQFSETIAKIEDLRERVGTLCSNLKILSLS